MSGGNEPLAADMMRMAVVAGIGEATWFTAKKEAGIGSRLDGMPGQSGQHWVWTRAARHGHCEFEMAGTGPRSRRRRGAGKGEASGHRHPIGIWAVDGDLGWMVCQLIVAAAVGIAASLLASSVKARTRD
jgi:hypothetical protein